MKDFDLDVRIETNHFAKGSEITPQVATVTRGVLSIVLSCAACDLTSKCPSANTRCTTIDTLC